MIATAAVSLFLISSATLERPYKLMVGDPAPRLQVDRFVKGAPVKDFKQGQVYVVEFWATWCRPCKESIPHITELQKKYGSKVQFVGISVWEPKDSDVEPFVKQWGEKMDYTIAVDKVVGVTSTDDAERARESMEKGLMSKAYLVDSGWNMVGIPSAFIVNADGKIAWAGDPREIDDSLAEVVDGKQDLAKASADYNAAMTKRHIAITSLEEGRKAVSEKRWDDASACFERVGAQGEEWSRGYVEKFDMYLRAKGSQVEAVDYMNSMITKAHWSTTMDMLAIMANQAKNLSVSTLEAGVKACDEVLAQIGEDHTRPLMTQAQMFHRLGKDKEALERVDRALKIAKGNEVKDFAEKRKRYAAGGGSLVDPDK